MSEELKPCPFCGTDITVDIDDALHPGATHWRMKLGRIRYVRFSDRQEGDQPMYEIHCPETIHGCGVEMVGHTRAEVIEKWNRRSTAPTSEATP